MTNEKQMRFSIYRTIGTLGLFSLLLVSLQLGGTGKYFINISAALFLFCFVFLALLCTFEKAFLLFIPHSVLALFFTPQAPVEKYAEISKYGSRYTIGGALILMLIGYIQMLGHTSNPENIGLALALTLLPAFYALLLSEVFFVIVRTAYSQKDGKDSIKEPSFQIRSLLLFLVTIGIICFTCIVFLMAFQPAS